MKRAIKALLVIDALILLAVATIELRLGLEPSSSDVREFITYNAFYLLGAAWAWDERREESCK